MMKNNQRFIAGAICPECQQMDSLLLDTVKQDIECVECGYIQSEKQRDQEYQKKNTGSKNQSIAEKVDPTNMINIIKID